MLSPDLIQKIQRIYIKSRHLVNDVFSGEYASAFRGMGMEFEEVREYMPGDDVRSIDWNVTAKMNKAYIKVFREERERSLMLMVDASASQNFGSHTRAKMDYVAELAAILAYTAIKSSDKVGLIIFTDRVERYIPPQKGTSHVWYVISEILKFKPQHKGTNLGDALKYFNQVTHRKSTCFVLSDYLDDHYEIPLKLANFKHDVIALMIEDPLEINLPSSCLVRFGDLEKEEGFVMDLGSQKIVKDFQKKREHIKQMIRKNFLAMNVDLLDLRTDQDYIRPLLKFFRLREKRL